jgi:hypothetical protein
MNKLTWCLLPLVFACSDSVTRPPSTTPQVKIIALSSEAVTGAVDGPVSPAPRVRVVDLNGVAMPNTRIKFTVVKGGGRLAYADTITDALGEARAEWIFAGNVQVNNVLQVSAGNPAAYWTFYGQPYAGPAARMRSVWWMDAVVFGGREVRQPDVAVVDRFGNAVSGALVQWFVIAGGGTVRGAASASATSQSSGLAPMDKWLAGPSGRNALVARGVGMDSVLFETMAIDSAGAARYESPVQNATYQYRLALDPSGYFIEDTWLYTFGAYIRNARFTGRYQIVDKAITLNGCYDDSYYGPTCYVKNGRIEGDAFMFGGVLYSRSK